MHCSTGRRRLSLRRRLWSSVGGLWLLAAAAHADPPVISRIPDQVMFEDTTLMVPFKVWDAETPPDQLQVTARVRGSTEVFDSLSLPIVGTGTNRWLTLQPGGDKSGTVIVEVSVRDWDSQQATSVFRLFVLAVNDPPQLDAIAPQFMVLGERPRTIEATLVDPDSATFVQLRAWSSRPNVLPDSDLTLSWRFKTTTAAGWTLTISPGPTASAGSTVITIEATDGPNRVFTSFTLTLQRPLFAPLPTRIASDGSVSEPVWADLDGDGSLDLLTLNRTLYLNLGNGAFSDPVELPATSDVAQAVPADFDGDGDVDLFVAGPVHQVLRNEGGRPPRFTVQSLPGGRFFLPKVWSADLDGDGDADLLLDYRGAVEWWRNDGQLVFQQVPMDWRGAVLAAPADYDADGDPDLLVRDGVFVQSAVLYNNEGRGQFRPGPTLFGAAPGWPVADILAGGWQDLNDDGKLDAWFLYAQDNSGGTNGLAVLRAGYSETLHLTWRGTGQALEPVVWADVDHDGYLDLLAPFTAAPPTPLATSTTTYSLYRNDGQGGLRTDGLPAAPGAGSIFPSAADIDNDGAIDLLARVGADWMLWSNQQVRPNSLPGPPTGLRAAVEGRRVTLWWNRAFDPNQTAALTYNVRVGTGPGLNDVLPSLSLANGVRLIPAMGNAGHRQWLTLDLSSRPLSANTLYWSVQAVDNSLQGGPFAQEASFTLGNDQGTELPVGVRLTIRRMAGGIIELEVPTPLGNPGQLEASTDLQAWMPITPIWRRETDGTARAILSATEGRRFFRLHSGP